MPGGIRTNLQRYVDTQTLASWTARPSPPGWRWKTLEQGAATSVLVATSPLLEGIGGRYFEDRGGAGDLRRDPGPHGVRRHAVDPKNAMRLWDESLRLLEARLPVAA